MKDQYAKTGVDVFDWQRMKRVNPEGYIVAHVLGLASRKARRKMYFCMLKQAMWAGNDALAEHATKKYLLFIRRERETVQEPGEGLLEPIWTAEKDDRRRLAEYRAIRFCRAILQKKSMYELTEHDHIRGKTYSVRMEETWKTIVRGPFEIMSRRSEISNSRISSWGHTRDDELISRAFHLITDIYLNDVDRKAFGLSRYHAGVSFCNKSAILLDMLKNTVNLMSLEQVVYFLEAFPRMPREFLAVFRIQYARKGGAFDLTAPPLKD